MGAEQCELMVRLRQHLAEGDLDEIRAALGVPKDAVGQAR